MNDEAARFFQGIAVGGFLMWVAWGVSLYMKVQVN